MKVLKSSSGCASAPSAARARLSAIVATVLAVLAVLACFATPAVAQNASHLVGAPLGTKRFERLLRAYVAPTDAQWSALGRLHEKYLEEFSATIAPEIGVIASTIGREKMTKEDYEHRLRAIDRITERIAAADNAFFNAATEALPLDRQPGMLRVREARERQRLLAGVVQFGPLMFGGGVTFVDLPNLVIKRVILDAVPADRREEFDALLRSHESRMLAQARAYSATMRASLADAFELNSKMMKEADEAMPQADLNARMREFSEAMSVLRADLSKTVRTNLDSNRSVCAQIAALLPESIGQSLRAELAGRTLGQLFMGLGLKARSDVEQVVARICRDDAITADVKAQLAVLLSAHAKNYVEALEAYAIVANETPTSVYMPADENTPGGENGSPSTQALARIRSIARDAMSKIATLLGERSDEFMSKIERESHDDRGTIVDFVPVKENQPSADSANADRLPPRDGLAMGWGAPPAFNDEDIERIGGLLGIDASKRSIAQAVVTEWKISQWDPKMEPLAKALLEAKPKHSGPSAIGTGAHSPEAVAQTRSMMATLLFELDEKLYADLATALGVSADDASIILLRLERANLMPSRLSRNEEFPHAVSRLLATCAVDPDTARRIIEGAKDQFRAITNDLPAHIANCVSTNERLTSTERLFGSSDPVTVGAARADHKELMALLRTLNTAFAVRIGEVFDAACVAGAHDAVLASALKRARLRSMYSEIYQPEESAELQLMTSLRIVGLSDAARERIDALRADYEKYYDRLSAELVVQGFAEVPRDGATVDREELVRRATAWEQLRFLRGERTAKVLSELRRIVGDELAASVPRLLVNPEAERRADQRNLRMGMMIDED